MMMAKRACGSEMRVFAGATHVMFFLLYPFPMSGMNHNNPQHLGEDLIFPPETEISTCKNRMKDLFFYCRFICVEQRSALKANWGHKTPGR